MAHTQHSTLSFNPLGTVSALLARLWDGLVYLGENSARARKAEQINAITDAELAERGLTRADLVRRVFSDGYH